MSDPPPGDQRSRLFARSTGDRPALFDAEALLALARASAGEAATGAVDREALEALCRGFEQSPMRLSFFGRKRAESAILDALVKRWRLERYLARHADIQGTVIARPIFVVAPYRTATTFLHQLLALDPDHRCPRIWEALHPAPPEPHLRGQPGYFDGDPRVAQIEAFLRSFARRNPELAQLHPVHARGPEECYGLLETSLSSHSFLFHGAVTGYLDWLESRSETDWVAAYRLYRDQIKLLQWWHPGKRWVLKSPVHLWNTSALLSAFPDALVVQIHRQPAECMVSFCTLLSESYRAIADEPDGRLVGAVASAFVRGALARCAETRQQRRDSRFLDVTFDRVIGRPLEVVRAIYGAAGLAPGRETEARMRTWLERAPTHRGACQRRSLGDFGLTEAEVDRMFAPYAAFSPAR